MQQRLIKAIHAIASTLVERVKGSYVKAIGSIIFIYSLIDFLEGEVEKFFVGHTFVHFLDVIIALFVLTFTIYTLYLCRRHKQKKQTALRVRLYMLDK